jgi:hypothetical protein
MLNMPDYESYTEILDESARRRHVIGTSIAIVLALAAALLAATVL